MFQQDHSMRLSLPNNQHFTRVYSRGAVSLRGYFIWRVVTTVGWKVAVCGVGDVQEDYMFHLLVVVFGNYCVPGVQLL